MGLIMSGVPTPPGGYSGMAAGPIDFSTDTAGSVHFEGPLTWPPNLNFIQGCTVHCYTYQANGYTYSGSSPLYFPTSYGGVIPSSAGFNVLDSAKVTIFDPNGVYMTSVFGTYQVYRTFTGEGP